MAGVLIGRDEAEVPRREAALLRPSAGRRRARRGSRARRAALDPRARRTRRASRWSRFEAAGAERIMLQDFLPRDLEMIDLMAESLFG